jgi:membrane-bound metal-dependent hydrolase YbcI (DUF457 family)
MPSPVGHALAGLAVHLLTARDPAERASRPRIAVTLAAALAPDLDLLLRFVDGRNHHQGASHSLGAAALAAVAASLLARTRGWARPLGFALGAGAAWASHLLLDYLSVDTNPPIGIPLLWPLAGGYFKAPWPLFLDIGRTLDWHTVRHDALAVTWEVVVILPILLVMWWSRRREA